MNDFPSNWDKHYCKACEVEISEFERYENDRLCDKCNERKNELLKERGEALAELEAIKPFKAKADRIKELISEIEFIDNELKQF